MDSILNPVRTVPTSTGDVEVRELRAIDAQTLIRMIAGRVAGFAAAGGQVQFDLGRITEIVTASEELANHLVLKSTGKEKPWLEQISMGDYLDVLGAAVELNFSEALEKKFRGVGDHVTRLLQLQRKTLPAPSNSSSAKGTPPPSAIPAAS